MSNRIKILFELTLTLKEVHMIYRFLGSTIWCYVHYIRMKLHRIYFLGSFITSKDVNIRFWDQKPVIYGIRHVDILYIVRKQVSIK